jgi:Kef-type K+ transport system membrane component KefB
MKKVLLFSLLLIGGLVASQALPGAVGESAWRWASHAIHLATVTALAFIMIHVGYEFDIDKSKPGQYGVDWVVACTAATFPWIFCSAYFIFVMAPREFWGDWTAWKESLLAGVFSAPTSAGVLFSMLAAAGLGATWLFKKARVLAIFDDLFVVLLMIPLKMMIVGPKWQLAVVVFIMGAQLWIAWRWLHVLRIPTTWPWVLGYALGIVALSEAVLIGSRQIDAATPIHIEVLLPAFVLGCMLARPGHRPEDRFETIDDPDIELDPARGHDDPAEERAATLVSAVFMMLVGLSMPLIAGDGAPMATGAAADGVDHLSELPGMSWGMIAVHVIAVTVLSNLGKMVPALCYRREAPWNERVALAIGMWPRGEVGAGVLVIALGYHIEGPIVTVALLSLIVNLVMTGGFIAVIKKALGTRQ